MSSDIEVHGLLHTAAIAELRLELRLTGIPNSSVTSSYQILHKLTLILLLILFHLRFTGCNGTCACRSFFVCARCT